MKKKKLKLEELRVQSFITELKPDVAHTAKGGEDTVPSAGCIISSIATVVSIAHGLTWVPESCTASHCQTFGGTLPPAVGGTLPPITLGPPVTIP